MIGFEPFVSLALAEAVSLTIFWRVVAFVSGAVVGSFLNVVIWRLPLGMNLAHPPSACPGCNTPIRWFDNVPVVSWMLLGAKCRTCKTPISARYPMVEALTGVLFLLAAMQYEGDWVTVAGVSLALAALVAISFIDLDHRIIPDVISLPGIVFGIVTAPFLGLFALHHPNGFLVPSVPWLDAVLCASVGALVGGGVIQIVRLLGSYVLKKEAMGFGDVKLLAMIGAFVGPSWVLFALVLACFAGALIGGVAYLVSRRRALPCEGTVRVEGDETPRPFDRVRVTDSGLQLPGAPPAPAGTRVTVEVRLDAHRALTDEDVEARFAGQIEAAGGEGWSLKLDGPFRSAAHEAAFWNLEAFSEPGRATRARMFFVLGLAFALSGMVALVFGQPMLLRASAVMALLGFALAWMKRSRPRACRIEATVAGKGRKQGGVTANEARIQDGVLVFPADRSPPAGRRVDLDITFPADVVFASEDARVTAAGRMIDSAGDADMWHVQIDPGFESDEARDLYETLAIFGQSARYIPFGPFLSIAGAAMLLYGPDVAWFVIVRYPEWTRSLLG